LDRSRNIVTPYRDDFSAFVSRVTHFYRMNRRHVSAGAHAKRARTKYLMEAKQGQMFERAGVIATSRWIQRELGTSIMRLPDGSNDAQPTRKSSIGC
jgi:hypothetical protein